MSRLPPASSGTTSWCGPSWHPGSQARPLPREAGATQAFVVTNISGTIIGPDGQPHQGTIEIVDSAVAIPGSGFVFNGPFSLQNGTGGLAGVHGYGTLSSPGGTGVGTYQGQIFFP